MKFIFTNKDVYKPRISFYQYTDELYRIVYSKAVREKGFENIQLKKHSTKEEVEYSSLSRTRRNIRELSLCNNFTYFATLTVSSSRFDRYALDDCQEHLRSIIKKIKRNNKDFIYIFITEKHKDGAFHFHGLVSGLDFYINQNGYLSNKDFDTLGFNSFSPIKDKQKVSNYILKYITKDCVKNSKGTVYISSRGLKKANKTYLPLDTKVNYTYENDFVKIKDFNINDLSKDETLELYTKLNIAIDNF